MSAFEPRDDALWADAGYRCAICQIRVTRAPTQGKTDGTRLGSPVLIDPEGSRGRTASQGLAEDFVLLCNVDAVNVSADRSTFSPAELHRLKSVVERVHASRLEFAARGEHPVRVGTHIAWFANSDEAYLFLKIVNDSLTETIVVNSAIVGGPTPVAVTSPGRRLPTEVEPGDLFETWVPLNRLNPGAGDVHDMVQVTLDDGRVISSTRNLDVARAGVVGGPGRPLSGVNVNWAILDDPSPNTWDVFISHAWEDKHDVADPLNAALTRLGLSVWYDTTAMRIGSSLRQSIDEGVANSAFAVLVISPDFLKKGWTRYELDGLTQMKINGLQATLPIWHRITKDELMRFSPSLTGLLARNTSEFTVEQIAAEIAATVRPNLQ